MGEGASRRTMRTLHFSQIGGRSSFGWSDWGFVCVCLTFFLAARRWNLANELGLLFTGIVP